MTPHEFLILIAGAVAGGAAGAAIALLVCLAAMRRRARNGRPGLAPPRDETAELHRLARRIRQIRRLARRTDDNLTARMEELRGLIEKANRVSAGASDGDYAPVSPGPEEPAEPPAILQKQRDHVFRLHLQGLEPLDIARRTNMPIGEVELTLKLYNEQKQLARAKAP